jgi:hypothetical protein
MELHPECHHAYLIRRVNRLYYLYDVEMRKEVAAELQDKLDQLNKIEQLQELEIPNS